MILENKQRKDRVILKENKKEKVKEYTEMPTCKNCEKKWTWKQTIKTLFKLKCPYCGKKQYESASSRQRNGIFGVIAPLILLPIVVLFDFSVGAAFILALLVVVLILGLYPFTLKLSNEEEPLF